LVLRFEQAETTHTAINDEITTVQSQLGMEHEKCEELAVAMNQFKTDQATLSVENEKLRSELVSSHITSEQLKQDLHTTKEVLSNAELALGDAQNSLECFQRNYDELNATAATREEEHSTLVTELTDKINFIRSHPFKAFFMAMIDIFKRFANAIIRFIGNVWFSYRLLGINSENSLA
jgi:chromosome segregation ATPase